MIPVDACSISIRRSGDTAIVEVSGEVDTGSVPLLAKALQNAARTGKKRVVLDAHDLTYIDSSGIQTLISFQQKLGERNKTLAVAGCHGIFRRLITIARLEKHLPIFTSIEEALQSGEVVQGVKPET